LTKNLLAPLLIFKIIFLTNFPKMIPTTHMGRVLDSREWTLDGGAKLINEVFDILLPIADQHWKTLVEKSRTRDISDREYYAKKN